MHTIPTLTDQYQRRFTYLRLSVTDACNFRCNYCLPDGYSCDSDEPNLSIPEIAAVANAFALNGTKKIRITGGEPTLRKDLAEIIHVCKTTPGIESVALTSNGYRITRLLPSLVDAGLDQLNLSADSLHPAQFQLITGHDKLQEVLAGLDLALELGLSKVKLNVVLLQEYNKAEIDNFFAFVKHKNISLRFIELMRTGDNGAFFNAQHFSGQEIETRLLEQGWRKTDTGPHAGPAKEYSHPEYAGRIGLIMPYSKDFCSSCNRLRVSSLGNLHLCLFADENQSLRPLLSMPSEQVARHIRLCVLGKKATHELHNNLSGSTRHLAMLGG
ncbi:GTP 3',8-cyclase MoaA [Teredinibacter turnerae]|uniref:GTP 3',8-cyclase MoaA n=1 Tax=Teredinibacter turnerae TaxID=2426 RepID=UPI000378E5AF|nr:GTP 3',8-cyclase MoaA [Teredinibacter turnerae]